MFAIDGTFVLHYEMKPLIIGDFDAIYSLKWLRDVDSNTCLAHQPQIIASSIKKNGCTWWNESGKKQRMKYIYIRIKWPFWMDEWIWSWRRVRLQPANLIIFALLFYISVAFVWCAIAVELAAKINLSINLSAAVKPKSIDRQIGQKDANTGECVLCTS